MLDYRLADFRPPRLLKGAHLQSALASLPLRQRRIGARADALLAGSFAEIIDCGAGVRLLAEHTPPREAGSGRLAVLIHGWEGSSRSLYMLSSASRLVRAGFRVIRLNLRDHGESHHLNPELFHSCRLEEVFNAVAAVQRRFPDEKLFLGGFSLGGNFALRIAAQAPASDMRIEQVAAVCPVIEPRATMAALDQGLPPYRLYFIRKWRRSLELKRDAFPALYDFGELERFRTLHGMTEYFVRHYTGFPDLDSYLSGYAVTGGRLSGLTVPTEILLADDDPVIPVRDVARLARTPSLTVRRSRYGGHCGFIADYRLASWLDEYVARVFRA
jgi:predicted alpha/beta-fold hydrolase